MALPDPHPGLVISYSYLWADEAEAGKEDGVKDRPCAIVVARQMADDTTVVTVVPITHTAPDENTAAIEIPAVLKSHLGLDDLPSWVVVSEVNEFVWPGVDLRAIANTDPKEYSYGVIPPGFFNTIKQALLQSARAKLSRVTRTE